MKKTMIIMMVLFMTLGLLVIAEAEAEAEAEEKDPVEKAFEIAEEEEKLVLLYFTADWCPPCQRMKAEVLPEEAVQKSLKANYAFVMIDTDKEPDTARKYEIRGIPSMVVLNAEGKEVTRFSGFRDKEAFIETIDNISEQYWKAQEEDAESKPAQETGTTQHSCCPHH